MAIRVRAADDWRDLSLSLLKPDFSAFERTPIRANDVSLDRRSLRREGRGEHERNDEKKTGNTAVAEHQLNSSAISKEAQI